MNKVILTGRITKNPEMRYTNNGIATVQFSLAVDRQMRDANGNRQADFINCVAWRQQADFIGRFIKKGFMICVEGKITTRSYQTQDNQTRYVTEVIVDQVENLQPRDPNAQPQAPNAQPQFAPNQMNNPSYGSAPSANAQQQSYAQPEESFSIGVADDDLPF